MARVTIVNAARLNAKFQALATKVAPQMKVAIGRAAQLIVTEQKRLVPVKTGALRDSIQWTFGDPPAGTILGGARRPSDDPSGTRATVTAGSEAVRYAGFVEYGTTQSKAQPFFFPGYRVVKKSVNKVIRTAVKQAIDDAAKG